MTGHDDLTNGLKTEILDYEAGEWKQGPDYPFSGSGDRWAYRVKWLVHMIFFDNSIFRIAYYATAATADSVYIIGGYTAGLLRYTSTIAAYKDGNWENKGNLALARSDHGAITSGSTTMIVGGAQFSGDP